MKLKTIVIGLIGILVLLISVDILIRLFYCSGLRLDFDSTKFNNISTPIISFFGFIGLIITIIILANQYKSVKSEQYYKHYKEQIELIYKDKFSDNFYDNIRLIDFLNFVDNEFHKLKNNKDYTNDVERFIEGNYINGENKSYSSDLSLIRAFNAQALILYKMVMNLIKEIELHKQLTNHHKNLLLDNIINNIIIKYLTGCSILKSNLKNIIDEFYIGFIRTNNQLEFSKFFNQLFFDLYDYIMHKPELNKYYDK